jgi:hypothetical protein
MKVRGWRRGEFKRRRRGEIEKQIRIFSLVLQSWASPK